MTDSAVQPRSISQTEWHDFIDPRGADTDAADRGLIDPSYENVEVGRRFGPHVLQLGDYRARRYDFIMGGRLQHEVDAAANPLAHPGSFSNELFEIYTLDYSASRIVGVHASEELWFTRPAPADARIVLAGEFVDKYVKRGQGYAVVEATAADLDGNILVRRRGTEIMRTIPGDVVGRGASRGDGDARSPRIETELDRTAPRTTTARNAAVGDWFDFDPQLVTFEQAALYSRFGEYVTSIHGELAAARAAGLREPIIQGQQQAFIMVDRMMSFFGSSWGVSGHLSAKFVKPAPVFSELACLGRVVSVNETETGAPRMHVECWLEDQNGRVVSIAVADCEVAR